MKTGHCTFDGSSACYRMLVEQRTTYFFLFYSPLAVIVPCIFYHPTVSKDIQSIVMFCFAWWFLLRGSVILLKWGIICEFALCLLCTLHVFSLHTKDELAAVNKSQNLSMGETLTSLIGFEFVFKRVHCCLAFPHKAADISSSRKCQIQQWHYTTEAMHSKWT